MAARPYRTVELHDRRSLDFLIFHFAPPYVFRHKQSDDTGEGKQRKGKPKSDTAAVPRLRTRNLLCPFAAVAAGFRHAAAHNPAHGRERPGGHLSGVSEAGQVACSGHVITLKPGVIVEDHGKLFPRNVVAGTEGAVSVACHNAVLLCPKHRVIIPCCAGPVRTQKGRARPRNHRGRSAPLEAT